ncbi:serine/threonine protein kinase [Cordyceps fumosorosea ARSEF 2679]|uniref:Serine/threonine protein kinase n=1 Tax=Cordyceps fumosorosea (strain ARSEF 2679) TaxID=1081104 RepID=A0A167SUN2_CORFA|nr:serine/threonine protein kinase [Cordyceps fumosorosea ARSEF 2679]OAA59940.1 serine/threonine protein kinase [Cordyceps fumosorosea ARSEF 2679]
MQAAAKGKADYQGRRTKLANSYQELLNEFSSSDLKSVGNYTLGRLIGKGSFGKVYLATHKLTNGSKVVLKSANKNDSNLAREIHHHRQFVHPHIARLYEVIVTENLVWLVLEYCSGDELYNYLLDHGPLPVDKVQKIFAQLVGAVSYVHLQSCVHRDLKLENILFDRHENVKLVDFGFTREYEGRVNHLQTFCGTICYSAPEMLKGEKYAGEKVDIWSLGVILYSLLCGELPFDDDDDNVTRSRILGQEPKYPAHLPSEAVALIKSLLSKRPILRPSLPDVLAHPFLADHAAAQQAILQIKPQPPFASPLEKDCLQRMRSAGVDIDAVIESVLSQRCDALTGWWILLLEKEERKIKRRELKRREKEAERSLRRLSAASSRLERLAPTLQDVDEDGGLTSHFIRLGDQHSQRRGRSDRRSAGYYDITITDLPELTEVARENGSASGGEPARPADTQSIRRAQPSPGETSNGKANGISKWKKKPGLMAHWKQWTHWFKENAKVRRKGHERHASRSTPDLHNKERKGSAEKEASPRPQTSKYPNSTSGAAGTSPLPKGVVANGHYGRANSPGRRVLSKSSTSSSLAAPQPHRPRVSSNSQAYKRQSLSPAPMTPRSTVRRSSAGLRGRKSTSSSVSSVRSLHHHHHTHSKASSTSSTGSVSTSKTPLGRTHSPHHSVKVLPATPTSHAFPSNIRLVRGSPGPAPLQIYNEGMPSGGSRPPGSPNPFAGGVQFAKRKKNLFKGPSLNLPTISSSRTSSAGSHSRSGSGSNMRRSTEVAIPGIQEEDEDHVAEEEEEIEEVEMFNPIVRGPGEIVEEHIIEDDELPSALDLNDMGRRASQDNGASVGVK